MLRRVTLLRFLLFCGLTGIAIGEPVRFLLHARRTSTLVSRVENANGTVEQERVASGFFFLPYLQIVSIDLSLPDEPLDRSLLSEIAGLGSLRILQLNERRLVAQDIMVLARTPHLEELSLCGTEINNHDVERLLPLKTLRLLDLATCNIDDECVASIERFTNLECLCVAATGISVDRLSIVRLKKLQIIDASYCAGQSLDLTPAGFGGLSSLRALSVRGSNIEEIISDEWRPADTLSSLDLRATVASIDGLASGAPNLTEIGIEPRTITVATLRHLANFESLSKLVIDTDLSILFLGLEHPFESVWIAVGDVEIMVPPDVADDVRNLFNSLLLLRPDLIILNGGQTAGDIYERRRVYSGAN